MKRFINIVFGLLLMLPIAAQNSNLIQTAAGKDFYFTLLNHWEWSTFQPGVADNRHVSIFICAVEDADITFSTPLASGGGAPPRYTWHMDAGWNTHSSFAYPDELVLQGVSIHSTGDIYVDIAVYSGSSSEQSVILPKHLLGKSYMLQGIPGTTINKDGIPNPIPTYSQFTVVGTENGTSVSVSPRVNMVCRSRGDSLIHAGQLYQTSIQENEVLLFQPENYNHDISGTVVESDKAVAVFQGNNVTNYPSGIVTDYVWEQARPTDAWGKEFIVAGTGQLMEKGFAITALEDNTQVEFYIYSMRYKSVTLNRGETVWGGENISGSGGLGAEYIRASQPVCCYMYTLSHSLNDGKGNPSMAEILPVDHMATEAHWGLIGGDNSSFTNTLLVTTRVGNEDYVQFNGRTLSEYATQSGVETYSIYGYTTYEIPHTMQGSLTTTGDGFSAYVMRVSNRGSGAASFNVSLPNPVPEDPCLDGKLLYRETSAGYWSVYTKELSSFCPGSRVSVTALVSYKMYENIILRAEDANSESYLAQYEKYLGPDTEEQTQEYAGKKWYKIGMSFVVPDGTSDLKFLIENCYNASIDSFEVRLCTPPVEIIAPDSVCIDTKNILRAEFENDSTFSEPHVYQWYFSSDSVNWEAVNEGNSRELKLKAKPKHSGWYKVYVADEEKINDPNCRAESEPFKLYVIEDCPPILCPEGVLLKHEDLDGTATSYSTAIDGLCENMDLSLIINLPSGHAPCRLMLRLTDSETGSELLAYDTGDVPADSLQVGTSFTTPAGVSGFQWTISNNGGSCALPIENSEIRLCMEPVRVTGSSPACRKKPHTLHAIYENYGTLESPEFRWEFSPDSMVWTELQTGASKIYTIPVVHRSHEGWYRVTVADVGNMEQPNCRETSEPFKLATQYCNIAVDQYMDTTACDTLLYYDLIWRGHVWPDAGTVVDTLRDIDIDDSVYVHKTLQTKVCCPDIRTFRVDSAVCDTLLPFLWFYQDTMLLFGDIGEQEVEYPHWRWENCIGEVHTLALDTFHCERLYPIIVNKYNWQLLLDYVAFRRIFPDMHPLEFQWFKDSVAIEGANADDYSEENELHGYYQLRIKLDRTVDNHDEYIWSNILDILPTSGFAPIIKRIYNSQGIPVSEEKTGSGVYLIHYQQGDRIWTEKKILP